MIRSLEPIRSAPGCRITPSPLLSPAYAWEGKGEGKSPGSS